VIGLRELKLGELVHHCVYLVLQTLSRLKTPVRQRPMQPSQQNQDPSFGRSSRCIAWNELSGSQSQSCPRPCGLGHHRL